MSELHPARVVWDVLGCWLIILASWTAVGLLPAWWVVFLAIPAIGTRYYALFIVGHDGLHRRLMNSRKSNDLLCDLFVYGPIGAITRINKENHLLHHHRLATEGDPDRHRYACFNKSTRGAYLFFFSGLSNLLPTIHNVFFSGERSDHPNDTVKAEPKTLSYSSRDYMILVGWQLILIVGLTATIGWWAYFLLWLLPLYIFT